MLNWNYDLLGRLESTRADVLGGGGRSSRGRSSDTHTTGWIG
jgi:hypothetical protein